jgi:hypothetical protein
MTYNMQQKSLCQFQFCNFNYTKITPVHNQLIEAMQSASQYVVAAMHRPGAGDVSILHDRDTCIARLPVLVIQS